jgi:gas vesicle protein
MARNRTGKLALGALVAAGIGYAAGVLTAPKSGRETRKDIQTAALKAKREAEAKLKDLHSNLSDMISNAKRQMLHMGKSAQNELEQALEQANTAKDKARELLSAIHEGEANNTDLQAAIEEVKQATQHLKSFVKENAKPQK